MRLTPARNLLGMWRSRWLHFDAGVGGHIADNSLFWKGDCVMDYEMEEMEFGLSNMKIATPAENKKNKQVAIDSWQFGPDKPSMDRRRTSHSGLGSAKPGA